MVYNEYTEKASMERDDIRYQKIRDDWKDRNTNYNNAYHIKRLAEYYNLDADFIITIVEDLILNAHKHEEKESALDTQVGGDHYKRMKIQPAEYCRANDEYLGWYEQNIIKYICRHKFKNGRQDVEKVIHYAQMILEEYDNA